ncbi:MAG: FxDxF family PEP-CTERM protein [Nitrosomonas sp.]|nr:FxDxF family PEP-CTERM protein [Nitrosomonas sp.]
MQLKSYHKKTSTLASAVIISLAALASSNVYAADAVSPKDWVGSDNVVNLGETITANESGLKSAYTGNPNLNFSAWSHTGDYFVFLNTSLADVSVTVSGAAGFAPGLTVWATGAAKFDGGTEGFGSEVSTAAFGTPHSLNATGAMGDAGTLWMANGQGGNVIETLGYAVSGPAAFTAADTGWGETIFTGAHDVSVTNTFENGVTGSTGANVATLTFNDLASGWYAVYVGGTDHASAGGAFALTVSAVPEAETWAMLLAGLGLVGWRLRRSPTNSCEAAA